MENKLGQLLNSLIERGWKPREEEEIKSCQIGESFYKRKFIEDMVGFYTDDRGTPQWLFTKSLREVCSKSSGLWQFVCENELTSIQIENNNLKPPQRHLRHSWRKHSNSMVEDEELVNTRKRVENYEYRLIESALCDEDKLGSFLLQNIVIKDE